MKQTLKELRQKIPQGGIVIVVGIPKPILIGVDESPMIQTIVIEKSDFDKLTAKKPIDVLAVIKQLISDNHITRLFSNIVSVKHGFDKDNKHQDVKCWYYYKVIYEKRYYLIDVKCSKKGLYKLYNLKELK